MFSLDAAAAKRASLPALRPHNSNDPISTSPYLSMSQEPRMTSDDPCPWVFSHNDEHGCASENALILLQKALAERRQIVPLLGAGVSLDAGIPLASQMADYLVQVAHFVKARKFSSVRRFIEGARWPSRHELRVDLMVELGIPSLDAEMRSARQHLSQDALASELRRSSPTLAYALEDFYLKDRKRDGLADDKKLPPELQSIARFLLADGPPRNVSYRSLLFHLCENEQTLIDSCFDHFIRDRTPTTTQQLLVFICRLFGSRVILTTNFDTLLEKAFTEEGLRSTVFEIQGEGTIPSNHLLLSQQMSIVKLHGGPHQKRTGFDLDDPLSSTAITAFRNLFEGLQDDSGRRPLLLAIGYSGSDRRVMDLVASHVGCWRQDRDDDLPAVLWIGRGPEPPKLLSAAVASHPTVRHRGSVATASSLLWPARYLSYGDGRLFLLETYQRLAKRFPVARKYYQAINFVPHPNVAARKGAPPRDLPVLTGGDRHFHIVTEEWPVEESGSSDSPKAERLVRGSSSALAALASKAEAECFSVISIDLSEISSVSALVDVLSERLVKFDHRLQQLRRPQVLYNTLSLILPSKNTYEDGRGRMQQELAIVIRYLLHALRRGRYLLALDSVDEFPSSGCIRNLASVSAPSHSLQLLKEKVDKFRQVERDLLVTFVSDLHRNERYLGDSHIALAARVGNPRSIAEFQARSNDPGCTIFATSWRDPDPIYVEPLETSRVETHEGMVSAILSCARRIQSEVGIVWIAAKLNKLMNSGGVGDAARDSPRLLNAIWKDVAGGQRSDGFVVGDTERREIIRALRSFNGDDETSSGDGLRVYRVEGAYYWLHKEDRYRHYQSLRKEDPDLVATIHHLTALFYHDELYDRSKDPRAFQEYIYHRTAALGMASMNAQLFDGGEGGRFCLHWFRRIVVSLQREKANLLARVRLPGFLFQLIELEEVMRRLLIPELHSALANASGAARKSLKVQEKQGSSSTKDSNKVRSGSAGMSRRKGAKTPLIEQVAYSVSKDLLEEAKELLSSLWGVMGDLLLAGGHPHSAVRCHMARIQFLHSSSHPNNSDSPPHLSGTEGLDEHGRHQQWNLEWLSRKNARLTSPQNIEKWTKASERDRKKSKGLKWIKALSDLLNALQDPLLASKLTVFANYLPSNSNSNVTYGPITPHNDLNRKLEDLGHDWLDTEYQESREKGTSTPCRKLAFAFLSERYRALKPWIATKLTIEPEPEWQFMRVRAVDAHEQSEEDVASGLLKRHLEFSLLTETCSQAQIALVYQRMSELHYNSERVSRFKGSQPLFAWCSPSAKSGDASKPADDEKHLLRLSRRRRRHECYRLCLLARRLSSDIEKNWARIEAVFSEAEAVVSRYGEPPDQQALAITRLLNADTFIRRAEEIIAREVCRLDSKYEVSGEAVGQRVSLDLLRGEWENECNKKDHASIQSQPQPPWGEDVALAPFWEIVRECEERARQLLLLAEPLLNEGRGENRWRFTFLLSSTRRRMLEAIMASDKETGKIFDSLFRAGGDLATALSNCGLRSDRHRVLRYWWEAVKAYTGSAFVSANGLYVSRARNARSDEAMKIATQQAVSAHWRAMTSRIGTRWDPAIQDALRRSGALPGNHSP